MNAAKIDADGVRRFASHSLRNAISNAFATMAGAEATVGEEYLHTPNSGCGRSVAGVIGWVGKWNGTGIFECSPEFAVYLANLMLGTEGTTLSEEALDAVAEMTNIIFGGMKTELEAHLGPMGLSTPTVVYGNDFGMRSTGEAFTVLPIQIEQHALSVKLYIMCMEDKKNPLGHFWAGSVCGAL